MSITVNTSTEALPVFNVDANGNPVSASAPAARDASNNEIVVGNVAAGSLDSGSPVKVGGKFNAGGTALTDGQRGDLQLSSHGAAMCAVSGTAIVGDSFGNAPQAPYDLNGNPRCLYIQAGMTNAAGTVDRQRGDTTGTWTHNPPTAPSDGLSGTIATSGGTATVAYISTAMRQEFINVGTATLWVRWGTAAAVNGAGSIPVLAGGSYAAPGNVAGTLNILSTAASSPYTVIRYS